MANTYDDSSIVQLKGAERFRMRPEMLLGSRNLNGAKHGLIEVVGNSLDEALSGYGDRLIIGMNEDESIYVRDFGRGVPLGWNEKEGKWNYFLIYMELYAGGKYSKNQEILRKLEESNGWDNFNLKDYNYLVTIGLNGVGASATCGTSRFFKVKSFRDGKVSKMDFIRGENQYPEPIVEDTDEPNGTYVCWKPDDEVFTDTNIPVKWLEGIAKSTAFISGMDVTFDNNGEITEYKASSITDAMKESVGYASYRHAFKHVVDNEGDICICDAEITIGPAGRKNEFFHNRVEVTGGSHSSGYNDGIASFFSTISREKGIRLRPEDYSSKLSTIISTLANKSSLRNQTKDSIDDMWIHLFLRDTVLDQLNLEYQKGQPWLLNVIDEAISDAKARIAATEMVKNVKEIEKSIKTHKTSQKFVTCRSYEKGDAAATEFFIVEGDSAMGGVLSARDSTYQCVLPIRGKSLNVYKATIDRLVANREIADFISILGTGIDMDIEGYKSFNEDALKVGKIIYLADGDIDGRHIEMLLTLILNKLFRPLMYTGKVYAAVAPLYTIRYSDGSKKYAYNEEEYRELKNLKPIVSTTRNKGLGEMQPEELWESSMNPKTRKLVQIKIDEEDMSVYDTLEVLFGRSTEARKKAILGSMLGTDYAETVNEMTSLSELIDQMDLDKDLDVQDVVY